MDAVSGVTAGQVKSGMLWIAGVSLLREGLQFAVMLMLVRLLPATAYGQFSVVSSILGLLTVFSFHSFLEHTLQVRPGETVDYQAQFTFGGFAQLAAVLVLNIVAIVLRRFPAYASVSPVLTVMSISFAVDWAAELRVKMLERELNWTRLRSLEAVGIAANAITAVLMALSGVGVYALLVPGVVAMLPFIYDLFFVMRWRPVWTFNWQAFRPSWHYGVTRVASGLAARGQQVLESSVLAGLIGLASLGVYGRAMGLASFACLKVMSVMTLTLLPMVTRFQPNSPEFQRASALVIRAVAWTSIPMAAVLSVVAGPLVRTLYGTRWIGVIPLLPWALAIAAITAAMEAAAFLLLADLEPRKTLALDILNLVGTGISLWQLLGHGLIVYMAGLLALQLLLALLSVGWLVQAGAIRGHAILQAFTGPVLAAALLGIVSQFWTVDSLGAATLLVIGFGAIYVASLRLFWGDAFLELLRFVPGVSNLSTRRF